MGVDQWQQLGGTALTAEVAQGTHSASTKPNGGGDQVYGFNSLVAVTGACGLYNVSDGGFDEMPKGAIISFCCMLNAANPTGASIFGFVGLQVNTVDAFTYMLGISNAAPYHLVLRKGKIVDGLTDVAAALNVGAQPAGCNMRRSTATFQAGTWHHLKMGAAANANGDVVLTVKYNDLTENAVTTPVWQDIGGMDQVTDDFLQIQTGSAPAIPCKDDDFGTATTKAGFAFRCSGVSRAGFIDQVRIQSQN